jgi:hypothetical protein
MITVFLSFEGLHSARILEVTLELPRTYQRHSQWKDIRQGKTGHVRHYNLPKLLFRTLKKSKEYLMNVSSKELNIRYTPRNYLLATPSACLSAQEEGIIVRRGLGQLKQTMANEVEGIPMPILIVVFQPLRSRLQQCLEHDRDHFEQTVSQVMICVTFYSREPPDSTYSMHILYQSSTNTAFGEQGTPSKLLFSSVRDNG